MGIGNDTFFDKTNCDRCDTSLKGKSRKMSWFTEECLCNDCVLKEQIVRTILDRKGVNSSNLEGCGYVPQVDHPGEDNVS